ncbi:MAG: hypothetical protein ABJB76_00935 [Candidatus Nitrosocosmicus sp.]
MLIGSICNFCYALNTKNNINIVIVPISSNIKDDFPQKGSVLDQYNLKKELEKKITFQSANSINQNVTLNLKYEPNSNSIYGIFEIPDNSQDDKDSIIFLFDSNVHNNPSGKNVKSTNQNITLIRNQKAQYFIGNEEQNKPIISASSIGNTLELGQYFENMTFNIFSQSDKWGGDFRIYLSNQSKSYNFAIQQQDYPSGKKSDFPSLTSITNPALMNTIDFENLSNTTFPQFTKTINNHSNNTLAPNITSNIKTTKTTSNTNSNSSSNKTPSPAEQSNNFKNPLLEPTVLGALITTIGGIIGGIIALKSKSKSI